ncbi:MAG: TlpA family protein disulfide reductase [Phycisphaerae bacterium]|jgi:thiol-disulfide isomerase/thioredoxin
MTHPQPGLVARFTVAAALALCAGLASAQPGGTTPPVAPAPASTAPVVDSAATDLLTKVRDAIKSTRAISYAAHVEDLKTAAVTTTATISATRADAGGWKVHGTGENITSKGEKTAFTVAYDGLSARSLRDRDKVVIERSLEKMDDLQVFFTGQSARHPFAWELLADEPFAQVSAVTLEAPTTVQGTACEVLRITLPASAGADDKADDQNAAATSATPVLRVFVSKADNLPRRIERLHVSADGTTLSGRVLELRDVATNADATLRQFTLDVPDGWRVRAADRDARRAAREAQREAEKNAPPLPEGVTWRSDPNTLTPGSDAPDFSLATPSGAKKTLADYKGKVLVLDFWATWCGPCKTAMPALQRLHEKYKDQPVAIVGMNAEGPEPGDPVAFKKESGYTYELLLQADAVSEAFKVRGLPTFYVIGPDGKVIWGGVGLAAPPGSQRASSKARAEYLEQTIDALIQSALPK